MERRIGYCSIRFEILSRNPLIGLETEFDKYLQKVIENFTQKTFSNLNNIRIQIFVIFENKANHCYMLIFANH